MGLLQRIAARFFAIRSTDLTGIPYSDLRNPTPEFLQALGVDATGSNFVTENTAMRISAVYACVRVLSESVSQLPLKVYRSTPTGPEEVRDHPAGRLLRGEPNGWQTGFEFREMMMGLAVLRGNAHAWVKRDSNFDPVALIPLHPSAIKVLKLSNGIGYEVTTKDGGQMKLGRYDVLHYRGLSTDGFNGESPVRLMRNSFGLAATLEATSTAMFANGAKPAGVLEHPAVLSDDAASRIKSTFENAFAGTSNTGSTLVLEEGMKWHQVGLSFEDAQLLESKKFSVEEIARAFRVPLHMLQSTEKSTSWGTGLEQLTLAFIMFSLGPWLKRIEETNNAVLLTQQEKADGYYFKHNINAFLRGDFKTRMDGYAVGLTNGLYSINEVRRLEDMQEIPDAIGGAHRVSANTVAAQSADPIQNQQPPTP